MTGAARHPDRPAAGKIRTRGLDRLLKRGIHHGGRAGAKALHRDAATALCGDLRGHAAQHILQAIDHARIVVADLEQHFGKPRNDARRTRIERDTPGGPYRARSAEFWETIVDIDAEPG